MTGAGVPPKHGKEQQRSASCSAVWCINRDCPNLVMSDKDCAILGPRHVKILDELRFDKHSFQLDLDLIVATVIVAVHDGSFARVRVSVYDWLTD